MQKYKTYLVVLLGAFWYLITWKTVCKPVKAGMPKKFTGKGIKYIGFFDDFKSYNFKSWDFY